MNSVLLAVVAYVLIGIAVGYRAYVLAVFPPGMFSSQYEGILRLATFAFVAPLWPLGIAVMVLVRQALRSGALQDPLGPNAAWILGGEPMPRPIYPPTFVDMQQRQDRKEIMTMLVASWTQNERSAADADETCARASAFARVLLEWIDDPSDGEVAPNEAAPK